MASSQAPRARFWFAPLAARSTAAPPPDPTPTAPSPAPLAPRTPFIRPMFPPARPVPPESPPAPAPAPAPAPPSQRQPGSPPKTTPVPVTANPPPTTSTPTPAPAPAPLQPVAPRTPFLRPLFAQATVPPPEPQVAQPTPTPPQTIPIPTPAPPQQTPQAPALAPAPAPTPRTPFLRPTPIPTTKESPSSPVVTTFVPPLPTTPTATPLVPQRPLPAATIVPPPTQPTPPPAIVRSPTSLQQPPPPPPISPSLSSQRITPKEIEPIKLTLIKNISPTPTTVTKNPSSPPPPLTLPPAVQYKSIQEKFPPEPEQKNITEKEIGEHAKGYNPKPSFAKTLFKNGKPTEKGHNQKKTPSSESDQEQGMRIITIAGENRGAVMELSSPFRKSTKAREGNTEPMRAFTNSNVQGVNNSIMFNSSFTHHDPGVHLSLIRKPAAMETSKDHKSSSNG